MGNPYGFVLKAQRLQFLICAFKLPSNNLKSLNKDFFLRIKFFILLSLYSNINMCCLEIEKQHQLLIQWMKHLTNWSRSWFRLCYRTRRSEKRQNKLLIIVKVTFVSLYRAFCSECFVPTAPERSAVWFGHFHQSVKAAEDCGKQINRMSVSVTAVCADLARPN